eukprot:2059708-Amphidinium_carterae.2
MSMSGTSSVSRAWLKASDLEAIDTEWRATNYVDTGKESNVPWAMYLRRPRHVQHFRSWGGM